MRICAAGSLDGRLLASVEAQDRNPDEVIGDPRLRAAVERALATGADWIWVLDGSALPRPDALAALLAALDRTGGLPAPALLTGVVVGPDGRVAAERFPWYNRYQLGLGMSSADAGLAPVRASIGPALVSREAAESVPAPPGAGVTPEAVLDWTARLLQQRVGYLVPESESEAVPGTGDLLGRPATVARLILTRAMIRPDRVGIFLELAERAGRRASAGRGA